MIGIGVVIIAVAMLFVRGRWLVRFVAVGCGLMVDPLLAVASLTAVIGGERLTAISRVRRQARRIREEEILAVELVAAGVGSGVSFDLSVDNAATFVEPTVGEDLSRMLRQVRHGHAPSGDTSATAQMIRIAVGSEASGAAIADQLAALAESELAADEATVNERMARLPVKMLFPLALLILPGFLLVAVAPAVIGGIARLGL